MANPLACPLDEAKTARDRQPISADVVGLGDPVADIADALVVVCTSHCHRPCWWAALLGAVPSACPGMEHMLEKRLLRGCPSPLPEPTTIKWEDIGSIKQVRALGGQSQYHCPPSACSNARGADQISSGRSWA